MDLREGEVNATKILKDVNLTYVTGKVEAWKRHANAKELSKMIPKDAKRGYKASNKFFKKSVKALEKFLVTHGFTVFHEFVYMRCCGFTGLCNLHVKTPL